MRWSRCTGPWLRRRLPELSLKTNGRPEGRPLIDFELSSCATGRPATGPTRGRLALGLSLRVQHSRLLKARSGARDGLEGAVEDPQRPLRDIAHHVRSPGLDPDHLQALDCDLFGQLAVDLDAENLDLVRHQGVKAPVDPAHNWRPLALECPHLLARRAHWIRDDFSRALRGADCYFLHRGRGVSEFCAHVLDLLVLCDAA